jgi:hypothetical protein
MKIKCVSAGEDLETPSAMVLGPTMNSVEMLSKGSISVSSLISPGVRQKLEALTSIGIYQLNRRPNTHDNLSQDD